MLRPAVAAAYRASALDKALDRAGNSSGFDIVRWRLSVEEKGFRPCRARPGLQSAQAGGGRQRPPGNRVIGKSRNGVIGKGRNRGITGRGKGHEERLWTKGLGIGVAV